VNVVSVVIPTRGRPSGLEAVLEDLAGQQGAPPFEVVVVCDGDDPRPYEPVVAREWPFELRFLRIDQRGPAGARNAGIELAEGEIFAFCEDDVRVSEQWLAAGTAAILDERADVVDGEVLSTHGTLRRGEGERTVPAFLPCSLFVRADIARKVDGFDEGYFADGLYFREDSDFGFRLQQADARVVIETDAVVRHPEQFFDDALIDRHLRRYMMDARLYRLWPRQFRASIERKRLGPIPVRRPLHTVALLWAAGAGVAATSVAQRRPGRAAAAAAGCFACGVAFRARYVRPVSRGLHRPGSLLRTLLLPGRHLTALARGARRFGGWGVFLP
jgi:glycosyltransferase involved in cell wall biosynthesis